MKRREFIAALLGSAAAWAGKGYGASSVEATLAAEPPRRTAAGQAWRSPPDCYFTYPHCNGFNPHTGNPVVARIDGDTIELTEWDFKSGDMRPLLKTGARNRYWDVAEGPAELFLVEGRDKILSCSLAEPHRQKTLLSGAHHGPVMLESLLSAKRDGSKVLYAIETNSVAGRGVESAAIMEVDVASGATQLLSGLSFSADHQHYCPHDESWIGFSHEGDIRETLDRVWGLHQEGGTYRSVTLWNELAPDSRPLIAGHERWAFHQTGALTVAYPKSTGRPRGLYFVDAASKSARLISASSYDWHCNISRDGRWAVVDTEPPHGRPREPGGRAISDIVLIDFTTGDRHWLARAHQGKGHPWHPHPHFSPDGRYVIYNDFEADGAGSPSRTVVVQLEV